MFLMCNAFNCFWQVFLGFLVCLVFFFIIVALCPLLSGIMLTWGPVNQGCFQAGCYFKPDFLFLLSKVVTLKTTGFLILRYILKMRIRDVLCRQIPEKAIFKWFLLLLVPEKIKPALSALLSLQQKCCRQLGGIFNHFCRNAYSEQFFGVQSSPLVDVFFQGMIFAVVGECTLAYLVTLVETCSLARWSSCEHKLGFKSPYTCKRNGDFF